MFMRALYEKKETWVKLPPVKFYCGIAGLNLCVTVCWLIC